MIVNSKVVMLRRRIGHKCYCLRSHARARDRRQFVFRNRLNRSSRGHRALRIGSFAVDSTVLARARLVRAGVVPIAAITAVGADAVEANGSVAAAGPGK